MNEVIPFPDRGSSRKETFVSADGSTVTIEVPETEPPLTVQQAIYLLSDAQFRIHKMMYGER